ncbi:DUF6175 family protein [Taibaiella soli]|uniref:Uncharacterized protein n=1 Tax=Taibaiella soli TaxID=1649169 RepID=A0A2W2ABI2_9BACT|nr:DUF6175 family protein [Taibaiella soli]PZF72671.1 hypothetical protein DN068_12460 [Taibaiella soli]
MKKRFILLCLLMTVFKMNSIAQNSSTFSNGAVQTVQPKVMVIPFTKEGEDIRTILEADVNRRIAITKVKEAFDSRGFTTVDFVAKLKAAKDNNVFTSDNQSDIKTQIIQMSGADIYILTEVSTQESSTGNSVNLVLTGYEASTGNSLANKVGFSGKFYTSDFGQLSAKAVSTCADDFMNTLQTKFTDIVNNGKSVIVDISFDPASQYKMSSEIGSSGLPLSDQLEEWMSKNCYKNNYHIQGTTDLKMIFDDVRIPLKDQATHQNYSSNKFALEIFKYLKSIGLNVKKDIKSNTIYIVIL